VESAPTPGWQTTRLWKELLTRTEPSAPALRHALEEVLTDVEVILNQRDPTLGNFTLHDSGHSRRVAEWMATLAEDLLGELSPTELAMLLLSAYLHDIGMTPELGRIKANRDWLLGKKGSLDDVGAADLQVWLDDEWDGRVPPIDKGGSSVDTARLADRIIAGYVRHRHNDWSEEWIRKNLSSIGGKLYPAFVEDLVLLCTSHHFDIDKLNTPKFKPTSIPGSSDILNLRYCACLLRVADVLDLDPERTPPILFTHWNVEGESAIFWHKDQEISLKKDGTHLVLFAKPADALLHHAIELTVEGVNRELAGCDWLASENAFHRMKNREDDLPHRWTLDASMKADIEPRGGAYEYIDGTFRPKPQRLLELVGGIELYGNELDAVREVLQNAFDAVREQIARERLRHDDPASAEIGEAIARTRQVTLTLRGSDEKGLELVCRDTGVGMSSKIIRTRFLVGGVTADHSVRALERACQEHGFSVGRTARFGIGVLSYFLLASKLVLRTRRSIAAGADEDCGWIFTTTGLDDFGELKKLDEDFSGTEVVLRIRPELLEDGAEAFARELSGYLRQTVRRVPCPFSFEAPELDVVSWSSPVGWADDEESARIKMLMPFYERRHPEQAPKPIELMSREAQEAHKRKAGVLGKVHDQAGDALALTAFQGQMPNGLGSYRVYRGHFELCCGRSFGYMDVEPAGENRFLVSSFLDADAVAPRVQGISMSWNGMQVELDMDSLKPHQWALAVREIRNCFIEIDWTSDAAGRLAVHRNTFNPSQAAEDAVGWVYGRARELLLEMVEEEPASPAALLNSSLIEGAPRNLTSSSWIKRSSTDHGRRELEPMRFPVVDPSEHLDNGMRRWRDREVTPTLQLRTFDQSFGTGPLSWHGSILVPTFVASIETGSHRCWPVPIWERIEMRDPAKSPLNLAEFPPEWSNLIGIETKINIGEQSVEVWNAAHPLVQALDDPAWEWALASFDWRSRDPLPLKGELLRSRARVAAWILLCLQRDEGDIWNGLIDRAPSFLPEAWERVEGLGDQRIVHVRDTLDRKLRTLGPDSWQEHTDADAPAEFAAMFERPGKDWRLE
jgi:hypothetical protein